MFFVFLSVVYQCFFFSTIIVVRKGWLRCSRILASLCHERHLLTSWGRFTHVMRKVCSRHEEGLLTSWGDYHFRTSFTTIFKRRSFWFQNLPSKQCSLFQYFNWTLRFTLAKFLFRIAKIRFYFYWAKFIIEKFTTW